MVEVTQADEERAQAIFSDALGDMGSFAEYGQPSYQEGALRTISVHLAEHRMAHQPQPSPEQTTVDRIVAFIKNRADETAPPEADEQDPLWTAFGYLHEVANAIQRGDWK